MYGSRNAGNRMKSAPCVNGDLKRRKQRKKRLSLNPKVKVTAGRKGRKNKISKNGEKIKKQINHKITQLWKGAYLTRYYASIMHAQA